MNRTLGLVPLALGLLVSARPAQPQQQGAPAAMKIEEGPWLGNKSAPLTMVEFTDYQCGFCLRFHVATFPEIKKKYIDTGKLRFVSRDLPLEFHSNAFRAAEAARCAGDQGKFWEMRDTLVANASKLAPAEILGYAEALKLNMGPFRVCLESGKYRTAIRKDVAAAQALEIRGTPTFIVGKTTAGGVNGIVLLGAQPMAVFEAVLDEFAK